MERVEICTGEKGEPVLKLSWRGKRACAVLLYGCNFRCPFCPAQRYSYSGEFGGVRFGMDESRKLVVQVERLAEHVLAFLEKTRMDRLLLTGGEPLPDSRRARTVVSMLAALDRLATERERRLRVVCRTNGHYIGRKGVPGFFSSLAELERLRITFEVCLMGTCEEEFALLSGIDGRYFSCQLAAYWQLAPLAEGAVEVVASLGAGHSQGGVQLVHPESRESMFRREAWSRDFEDVFQDTAKGDRMPAYCIEDTKEEVLYRCVLAGCVACRGECAGLRRVGKRYGVDVKGGDADRYREDYREFLKYFNPVKAAAL